MIEPRPTSEASEVMQFEEQSHAQEFIPSMATGRIQNEYPHSSPLDYEGQCMMAF